MEQIETLETWSPINLGGLKNESFDWIQKDYQFEILDNTDVED